jgi:pimeloyl-ACP methyl ester carboxylesterase
MDNWVLLRGLTRDGRHWGAFPELIRERFPLARVTCVDLPGAGCFHQAESPVAMADMVAHCRRTLRDSAIAPPYFVLALSLGGMVAVEWAHAAPGELCGCVLMNTSLRQFNPFYRRLRPQAYPAVLRILAQGKRMPARERGILELVSNQPARRRELLPQWIALQEEAPISPRNACRQLFAAMRYRAPAAPPAVPILLLASRHDRLVHYSCSCEIARRWNLDCYLHAGAGHDLPLDDGPWVIERIAARFAPGRRDTMGESGRAPLQAEGSAQQL